MESSDSSSDGETKHNHPPDGSSLAAVAAGNSRSKAKDGVKNSENNEIWTTERFRELVNKIDPGQQFDEDVEKLLLAHAHHYMEEIIDGAASFAVQRKGTVIEPKDVQTYLERSSGESFSCSGVNGSSQARKPEPKTEDHKQRMAIIKRDQKKH